MKTYIKPLPIILGTITGAVISHYVEGTLDGRSTAFIVGALVLAFLLTNYQSHVVRIKSDAIRIPLLVYGFPWVITDYVLFSAMPVFLGGHPNKRRLLEADFYAFPISLFWAAWDGEFVKDET